MPGWLVISRREGELVRIGNAVVRVKDITAGTVKLAIHAPSDQVIMRGELEACDHDGHVSDCMADRGRGV